VGGHEPGDVGSSQKKKNWTYREHVRQGRREKKKDTTKKKNKTAMGKEKLSFGVEKKTEEKKTSLHG